jgi:CubicO group peptidase (beta-lactamase class C family)
MSKSTTTALALLLLIGTDLTAQTTSDALTGLWYAKQRFGPDVRGRLVIDRPNGVWRASVAGRSTPARQQSDSLTFELPGNGGKFRGHLARAGASLTGWWIYPGRSTALLTLTPCGPSCFQGEVDGDPDAPYQTLTFYLRVSRSPDGAVSAFLRNPERNLSRLLPVRALRREGDAIALLDRTGKVLTSGPIRDGVISIPIFGTTFEFVRLADTAYADFYPRGRPSAKYSYVPPRAMSDGWPVARLRDVGISEDSIAAFIQLLVDTPPDSATAPETHALLIARHGKLVLEEYFHGVRADQPHDTRSGTKTQLTALVGAAMHAGVPISPETRVYATLRPAARGLPPSKQTMTLEHLLTMSAGIDCNDSGERPGDEDLIQQQTNNPDWMNIVLDVDMVRENGTAAVYCSMKPYLGGLVLERVAGRPLPDLFEELIARPLDYGKYYLMVTPLGEVYFGGGHRFVARDYLKLPQVYLDGGTWRGRRIFTKAWVERSMQPRFQLGSRKYGYLWWVKDYEYRGRTIQAYMQLGNGSQNAIFIPELDLVIVTFGANYSSPTINYLLNVQLPKYILSAIAP